MINFLCKSDCNGFILSRLLIYEVYVTVIPTQTSNIAISEHSPLYLNIRNFLGHWINFRVNSALIITLSLPTSVGVTNLEEVYFFILYNFLNLTDITKAILEVKVLFLFLSSFSDHYIISFVVQVEFAKKVATSYSFQLFLRILMFERRKS